MVFHSPQLAAAIAESGDGSAHAWYDDRNDRHPATLAGWRSAVIEHAHTRTYDRQQQFGGNVHDNYSQSTYLYRDRSVVR